MSTYQLGKDYIFKELESIDIPKEGVIIFQKRGDWIGNGCSLGIEKVDNEDRLFVKWFKEDEEDPAEEHYSIEDVKKYIASNKWLLI